MGCAAKKANIKAGYNFAGIHRLAMGAGSGAGHEAVATEFVRQLVTSGLTITEQSKAADAVLVITVVDYKPDDKTLIFLGKVQSANGAESTVTLINPVVSMAGRQAMPETALAGWPKMQMVSGSASLGVIAQLKDAHTGQVVWTDSYSYEGLDMASAARLVVERLATELKRVIATNGSEGHS